MSSINPRQTRLQTLRDRWFTEPLAIIFPDLGINVAEADPLNRDQFLTSWRMNFAFAPSDNAEDRKANLDHFSVEDPESVMVAVSSQFQSAALKGQVDPQVLKDAFVILDVYCEDRENLTQHYAPGHATSDQLQYDSNIAGGTAAAKAQALIAELATEVGISLPISKGRKPGGK